VTRVLVTGATGYIGRHAVAALQRRGHEVVAVGSAQADLLALDGPERAVAAAGADTLLHLAWYAEHGRF